jgi:hypothetical protein
MMKMKLDLDSLSVDSFDTAAGSTGRGTVRGLDSWTEPQGLDSIVATCDCPQAPTGQTACGQATCGSTCTCPNTLGGEDTCWHTCRNTCNVCGPQGPEF